jgi:hypothetical protein
MYQQYQQQQQQQQQQFSPYNISPHPYGQPSPAAQQFSPVRQAEQVRSDELFHISLNTLQINAMMSGQPMASPRHVVQLHSIEQPSAFSQHSPFEVCDANVYFCKVAETNFSELQYAGAPI